MIKKLVAYNIDSVEKYLQLSKIKNWEKSKLLSSEQFKQIESEFQHGLYSPKFIIKILFFIFSLIGLQTIAGPIFLIFQGLSEIGFSVLFVLVGGIILFITEKIIIKEKKHYKSGITEAGVYSSYGFILGALLLNLNNDNLYVYLSFVLCLWISIRYLDILALLGAILTFVMSIFLIGTSIGGVIQDILPFLLFLLFLIVFYSVKKISTIESLMVYENHFILLKTLSLIIMYLSLNYFVVRELSEELLGLRLQNEENIPFYWFFYIATIAIPVIYLWYGVKNKSILFIRVSLITIGFSVFTFKYYFSLGMPVVTITVAGGMLIVIALLLMKYLKTPKNGFTRENIMIDKWAGNENLASFVASQTLGGNSIKEQQKDFGGGSFGGGGAGSDF